MAHLFHLTERRRLEELLFILPRGLMKAQPTSSELSEILLTIECGSVSSYSHANVENGLS